MSKKVVHLSDEAHELAKEYCKNAGIKMSDWVAQLIHKALIGEPQTATPPQPQQQQPRQHMPAPVQQPRHHAPQQVTRQHASTEHMSERLRNALVPKKKSLTGADIKPQQSEDGVPVYAQPPFWSRAKS